MVIRHGVAIHIGGLICGESTAEYAVRREPGLVGKGSSKVVCPGRVYLPPRSFLFSLLLGHHG